MSTKETAWQCWQSIAPYFPTGDYVTFNQILASVRTGWPQAHRNTVIRGVLYARTHGIVQEATKTAGWKNTPPSRKISVYLLGEENA